MGFTLSRLSIFRLGKAKRGGGDILTRIIRIREGMRIRIYINIRHD